jgi:hypothetical protein
MATKKTRRRRPERTKSMDRVPDAAEPREPWAAGAIARTANVVFGGLEVLTVGVLRLSSRLVTNALTGAITVGAQAGALAVHTVREAVSDATEVARDVAGRAGTPHPGRPPAGARRRASARRAAAGRPQPVTELTQPAA